MNLADVIQVRDEMRVKEPLYGFVRQGARGLDEPD
jgi:hypothetical protein